MSFKFLNDGQEGVQRVSPIDTFIDPVSKIRVSNPSNLIDTDFEYGLQPTKWETVELINNTPAFFSKGGDTTITDITGITTNAGTREITVTTAFPHGLAVGIPIRVAGTKSVTADGSYIINATPTELSFTYLARANQEETISIFDLYSSIITGEFFQGSQISIDAAEGITTDGGGTSVLTVKTENKHGFGPNTPFYFLNLNSTISQEFEAQNTASLSFDPTNSSVAQTFDGSNTLLKTSIDLSNSATTSNSQSAIQTSDPGTDTITVTLSGEDWSELKVGAPLYYDVTIGGGYFQANPRGVVFIKGVDGIDQENNIAVFQVSEIPGGDAIPVLSNMTGFFQIADKARTFAGNNQDPETQVDITVVRGDAFEFDGANVGYPGVNPSPPPVDSTVVGFSGENITVFTAEGSLDYYVGAMLKFETDSTPPTGLVNGSTYFVTSFSNGPSSGLYVINIAELPNGSNISPSGGGGVETFTRIGISVDRDIVHVKDSNFSQGDMLEYVFPEEGSFSYDTDSPQTYFFVKTAYDAHNYSLSDVASSLIAATGGSAISTQTFEGRDYTVHSFNVPGTFSFVVDDAGTFDQQIKVSIRNGTFDGLSAEENTITPEVRSYTVVVDTPPANEISRVSIAYPQDELSNDIPFSEFSPLPISATGGAISIATVSGTQYKIHSFTSTGNSTFAVDSVGNLGNEVEYLIIAGGGKANSGGGGAGGYRCSVAGELSGRNSPAESPIAVSPQSYTVTVGAGASSGYNQGGSSSFAGITSIGGGAGETGWTTSSSAGRNGGSGGGGGSPHGTGFGAGGLGTAGQGHDGGRGYHQDQSHFKAGGGGGAGGTGGNATTAKAGSVGGAAGAGLTSSITGTPVLRAVGGAGTPNPGSSGAQNTGNGGVNSGAGMHGIVIIRYPIGSA